ncbi:MAG: hypothetical protein AAF488_18050, partial [Planctomycetota bacterium]
EAANLAYARYVEAVRVGTPGTDAMASNVEQQFLRAVSLDENNHRATYALSQLLRFQSDAAKRAGRASARVDGEIIRWLERTVSIAPKHTAALSDLGADLIARGDFARAETVLKRSVDAKATGRGVYNLGLAELYSGKPISARKHLEAALRHTNEEGVSSGDIHYFLVYTYLAEGDTAGAKKFFDAAKAKIPELLHAEIEARLTSSTSAGAGG